jgi:hypothetical protein
MVFNNKVDFEEYLKDNGLEIVGDYPASYKEDQRHYTIAIILGTQDLPKYCIKIDYDAGFPMAVILDNNNNQINVISLRQI